MSVKDILVHIRASFLAPPPPSLSDLLPLIDVYISDTANSSDDTRATELDNGLLDVYSDAVNHSDVSHIAAFVGVLYALRMVLSSAAIISWFDSLLRRALREPRLAPGAVAQAKELVLMPLYDDGEVKAELLRRRLVQLYVQEAPLVKDNTVEQMEQEADERARMTVWKNNLEDLLVSDGLTRPKELFEELNVCFRSSPESRLQLCILLNRLSRSSQKIAVPFANSPLFESLLFSLQVDQSTTQFSIGVTSLIMLLPALAVHAPSRLNSYLPSLVTILGRVVCWKLRQSGTQNDAPESPKQTTALRQKGWKVRDELDWKLLESTSESPVAPNETRLYFTFMYGLYPCNTIAFLRNPVAFLRQHNHESMFTKGWDIILDEDEIKSCSRPLLRGHVVHPSIIIDDSAAELANVTRWTDKDIATVAAECTLLDIQNVQRGATGHNIAYYVPPTPRGSNTNLLPSSVNAASLPLPPSPAEHEANPASRRSSADDSRKSLQIMIDTHAALTTQIAAASEPAETPEPEGQNRPRYIVAEEALSILQRDVLILRNQLNFEVYLKELVQQHVGRLHRDTIVSRGEEAERQGLHIKLKDYKSKLAKAQEDLATIRSEAAGTKQRHTQWVTELQDKLSRFREEKKSWAAEAVELRSEVNEAKSTLKAQNELLSDAQNEVFNLKQQLRESAPKIEKIAAYEQRIDQLVKAQALRDDSPEMREYRENKEKQDEMISNYAKMELKLGSLQHANEQLVASHKSQEDELNLVRSRVEDLTRRLASATASNPFNKSATKAAAASHERIRQLEEENNELRNKNAILMDEVEEVKAMVEFLRSERVNFGGPQSPLQHVSDPSGPSPRLTTLALADLADASADRVQDVVSAA
ncbi:Tuberous sclerosis 1 protein [Ceratobasidium sp. AG-Ba]|nr:Tuberous sclerosis 1 protein [Ceratobasidium sp. AG-Ba]QRV91046.1 Tuberous sclerosis 1 protein [Ceratobasidium sp. AG-Ba]QRW05134.1 Tuberous sclerosis 1 protein [Ceratobasidium sp. AG-Ba]